MWRRRVKIRRIGFGRALRELKEDIERLPPHVLARRTWDKIASDEVTTLSTSFAYFWAFAIPPLLLLIVMTAAILNRATSVPVVENLRQMIRERAPLQTRQVFLDLVDNAVVRVGDNVVGIGALGTAALALWSGSGAVGILIKGFNRAYGVEETRPFLHRRALNLGLTLLLVFFTNLAFGLLVFGQRLGDWTAGQFGLGSIFDTIWNIGRWPFSILGIMLVLALLYWSGPNVRQPFRWVSPGSIAATVLWLLVIAGFGFYLKISNAGSSYGVVGSVIVLLVFLNFTGITFFLGAEVNAVLYKVAQETAHPAPHRGTDPLPILADG
jgi:membrane protein